MTGREPGYPDRLRVLSLFSGVGGLDLGLERAGMQIVAHSEIDPLACRVLAARWPGVPNVGDVSTADMRLWRGEVDVIAGGFPCQDVSVLGHKAGIQEGTRSGLWAEFYRLVREIRPRYVIVENVAAFVARGLDRVLRDLAAIGFDAEWSVLSACSVGAPHTRERLFIVAYPHAEHGPQGLGDLAQLRRPACKRGPDAESPWADAVVGYVQAQMRGAGMADGLPDRLDRSAAVGNAVVPQVARHIGELVVAHHEARRAVAA